MNFSEFLLSGKLIRKLLHGECSKKTKTTTQPCTYWQSTLPCGKTAFHYRRQMWLHHPSFLPLPSLPSLHRGHAAFCPMGSLYLDFFPPLFLANAHSSSKTRLLLLFHLPLQVVHFSLRFSRGTQPFLLYELTHPCFVTLCFQVSFLLELELFECPDCAFFLCFLSFGSTEWMHLRCPYKDRKIFPCQCS